MFDLKQEIQNILQNNVINSVLDLGAGKGQRSLLCSEFGAKVTAVDNLQSPLWQFNIDLLKHGNIQFIKDNIENYITKDSGPRSMVLLLNVIAFIKKTFLFEKIIKQIIPKIGKGGFFVLSFFFDDDPTMQSPNINFYNFEDFSYLEKDFEIIHKINLWKDDLHKPHGAHKHHIGYLVLKKT